MNKIIFLSLFSFALTINSYFEIIDQTNDKITINFNLQDYEIKNNQLGNIFVIPGAGTRSLEGEPSLPSLSSISTLTVLVPFPVPKKAKPLSMNALSTSN